MEIGKEEGSRFLMDIRVIWGLREKLVRVVVREGTDLGLGRYRI